MLLYVLESFPINCVTPKVLLLVQRDALTLRLSFGETVKLFFSIETLVQLVEVKAVKINIRNSKAGM